MAMIMAMASVCGSAPQEEFFTKKFGQPRTVVVAKIIDTATFLTDKEEKIRLIGLKAPEPPPRERIERDENGMVIEIENPESTVEEQVFKTAQTLLKGKKVRLEFDAKESGDRFETLAYVFLEDGTFANAEILRQGCADLQIAPPNIKRADELRAAYREARRELRGIQGE